MVSNHANDDNQAVRNSKLKFLLVVALFILPIGTALFLHLTGWRPKSTINHGTLVQPVRPMPPLSFRDEKKSSYSQREFERTWKLVVATTEDCSEDCLKNLYAIRQVHIGQGKHQHRVQRLLIHRGELGQKSGIAKKYPNLVMLQADSPSMQKIGDWLAIDGQPKALNGTRIYMIDPLGNYMMYYAAGYDPAGLRKDLARLLRVSQIG